MNDDDDYYEEPEEVYEESPCRKCKVKGECCQNCIWGEEP